MGLVWEPMELGGDVLGAPLSQWPGPPYTGKQWLTCFDLMETLIQNSTISPPSLLGSHWQVFTTTTPCFKSLMAFVVPIWQTCTLPLYLSLWVPEEPLREGKRNTNLVCEQWYLNLWAQQLKPYLVSPTKSDSSGGKS